MTRASDTAKLLGAGATILDGTTISTADNTAQLTLTSTDADGSRGPQLALTRTSASPADNDLCGVFKINGKNDAAEDFELGEIVFTSTDVSNGSEDSKITINGIVAGASAGRLNMTPSEAVFNEDSLDIDFRVEGNGDANALFVEGETDNVGVGTNDPASKMTVNTGVNSSTRTFLVNNEHSGGSMYNALGVYVGATDRLVTLSADYGDSIMAFQTAGSERMRLDNSGNLLVGTTSNDSANVGARLKAGGRGDFTVSGGICSILNRNSSDGAILAFNQDNSNEGTISVSGSTISYNGGHLSRWSQLADNTRDNTLVKGTVMTNLDQMAEWTTDGVTEDNEQLNCMAISSVEGDANVAGVFVNWDNDDEVYTNDMNVAMTGDMVIRIAKDTTVSRGDLLMSAGDGTAKPQGDDIVKSKTIAKVTSINVSHTYDDGTYLVPCVLMAC